MNGMRKFFCLILMSVLLLTSGCSPTTHLVMGNNTESNLFSNAVALWEAGETESATYQMALYLQANQDDAEAIRLLIDWYTELGEISYAKKYIKMLGAQYAESYESGSITLTGETDSKLITQHISDSCITVSPLAVRSEKAVLSITGKNLFSGKYKKDEYLGSQATGWRTSEWFFVDDTQKSLTISGGFNRAVWQFELFNGERVLVGDESKTYRVSNSNAVKNMATAVATIPDSAIRCRIAYAFEPDELSDTLDERIQIEYGTFPSDYEQYHFTEINLPDMTETDSLIYNGGEWSLVHENTKTTLDLDDIVLQKGDTVSINASLAAMVTIDVTDASINKSGVYGVTWEENSSSILLERTDDAIGLSFNYMNDEEWAGPYQNDFDQIYPWSDLKLCAIDSAGNVLYENDPGFATDGSVGDIFVEIPKHYVKREVKDGKEYIAISATEREGFQLDPSFRRKTGEIDHIYVSAYFTSLSSDEAKSVSGKIPQTNHSLDELRDYMLKKTHNYTGVYSEIDLFSVMTIQRLFLIETAVRNSQAFWQGETSKAYWSESAPQQYALVDSPTSNMITVTDDNLNRRFSVGDAVCIATHEQFFGGRKYDNSYSRVISDIRFEDGKMQISFDGEPLDIIADTTQIAHVADVNGKTDSLPYHTGKLNENDGLSPFRYRYFENLWGNGFVLVDGVSVKNKTIEITYPNGKISTLNYDLGLQPLSPGQTDVDYGIMNISKFGYDDMNPLVMLPSTAGASVSTAFGDTLYTGFADGWEKNTVNLLWGGTWDLRTSCGLFCYRFLARNEDNLRENASRMTFSPIE